MNVTVNQEYSLEDNYNLESGRVYLTGIQALVRLPMDQRRRDLAAGLNTAGFISGYRGSPIGGYDQALWRAAGHLKEHHIHFEPGLNEDLAATAVWGSQQLNLYPGARYDGVFSIWYGKGPGVDRCGDVMSHGNFDGTSENGGVLFVAGDDHGAVSSTVPHQSDHNFAAYMMPELYPASVQEILDMGLMGWALSRYSGNWVGFKCVSEVIESSATVDVGPERLTIKLPEDFELPEGGLHIRDDIDRFEQEARQQHYRSYAALAFARANGIDRAVWNSPKPRFGIITAGKSYLDVRKALEDLGIDEAAARGMGLRLYKVGLVWPLERDGARAFAEGLEEVLVVEEKRAIIENQIKEQLYNWRADVRPRVIGKFDESGNWLLPSEGELTPAMIARVIAGRLKRFQSIPAMDERLEFLDRTEERLAHAPTALERLPFFCSGCPHNTSTRVPEGSRATAGIGCHTMARWMNRRTGPWTHMGGEGVPWVGQAPFTDEKHIFANLGDGTYHHSGVLAIRASIAAGVNITYKILYNDAVAMTGGQPAAGSDLSHKLTAPMIARQVLAEGVTTVVLVSDEPDKYAPEAGLPREVETRHRDELDRTQRELREVPGVSVLIYDQTCAAEKRRRRKRGTYPDPAKRLFINEAVCEGCGDCSEKSNCVSVIPVETEFGRKRAIDQHSCNKDYSCVNGFCPSFVTVLGGDLKKPPEGAGETILEKGLAGLPEPELPDVSEPYSILVTGIGGTGVITVSALVGMAAHLEGKGCTVLDMTGLAQKNGAVFAHVRIARDNNDLFAVRISAGGADLLLGCDMVSSASAMALSKLAPGSSRAVINDQFTPTAHFVLDNNLRFEDGYVRKQLIEATGGNLADFVNASRLATALLGQAIATNLFLLGFAYQRGLVPVSAAALERAIDLNGVSVGMNKRAFGWGRLAAHDIALVEKAAAPLIPASEPVATELVDIIAKRVGFLTAYQNAAYGERYRALVERVAKAEQEKAPGHGELAEAVARYYFKVMAYKDEYEVARLFADPAFKASLEDRFAGDYKLRFNLAPPLFSRRDPDTGHLIKSEYGPWMLSAYALLARLKGLRGTALDPFGHTAERRAERGLIVTYEATVADLLERLGPDNHGLAVEIASLPDKIRGYGHVKEANMTAAAAEQAELLAAYRAGGKRADAAE